MDLREYQTRARATGQQPRGGPHDAIAPMLGLAAETGSILDIYKKYLRDRIDLEANREFLREELGDLLWYTAAVATACGLDLEDVAAANLRRTSDLYPATSAEDRLTEVPVLDAGFPEHERFPRRLVVEFTERRDLAGRLVVAQTLVLAEPNAFPDGALSGDRPRGYTVGGPIGDPLTDNTRGADAYRFHDALHLGFLAVLGWSPNLRALLRVKRKSDPVADECEDGARAIFTEEGLAAVLSRLAHRRLGFLTEAAVTSEIVDVAQAATTDLEVNVMPGWLWRRAISAGFQAMHHLAANGGGFLTADLDARTLNYAKYLSERPPASAIRA